MKAHLHTPRVQFELEAQTPKELFKLVAETEEVFSESHCGLCQSEDIRFTVRTVDGNDYFELTCKKCGGKLAFGQSKAKPGHLFPQRKLTKEGKPDRKKGEYSKSNGWTKYRGETKDEAE